MTSSSSHRSPSPRGSNRLPETASRPASDEEGRPRPPAETGSGGGGGASTLRTPSGPAEERSGARASSPTDAPGAGLAREKSSVPDPSADRSAEPDGGGGGGALSPEVFRARLAEARPRLVRFARRRTASFVDAEDLVQDTIQRAIEKQHLYREDKNLEGWLARMLANVHVARIRRDRHELATSTSSLEDVPADEPPARSWLDDIDADDVRRALARVSPPLRRAFEAFHFQRMDQGQIARREGVTRNAVATRVFRARAKIAELLRGEKESIV